MTLFFFFTDLSSPTPPPVPKRPETIGTNANKRAMPCSVTSISLLTKENIKSASHVDLLNEKRRLAVELEDVKQKRILKKDIKHLRKQIELLENGNVFLIFFLIKAIRIIHSIIHLRSLFISNWSCSSMLRFTSKI